MIEGEFKVGAPQGSAKAATPPPPGDVEARPPPCEESAFDLEWAGITGRVKVLLADATEQTSSEIALVKAEVARVVILVKGEVASVKDEVARLQHGMEDLHEKFERLDSKLDGINGLLSKLIDAGHGQK